MMIDTPILPNLFRLFDIQRGKQENLEKCSSCNDENEDNSDEETKDEDNENNTQEGMEIKDILDISVKSTIVWLIWAVVIIISALVGAFYIDYERIGTEVFNKVIGVSTKGNLQNIVDGLPGYNDEASKVQKKNSILTCIVSVLITLLIIFVPVLIKHPENRNEFTKMVRNKKNAFVVGLMFLITGVTCWLYTLSKPALIHSVIDSIENTIGYVIINCTGLNLREYMTSKSFEKWADEGKSIILNFNPLITMFSLYNMDTSFVSMANDENTDFTLKEGVNEDAFKHIFRYTAIKRLISQFAIIAMTGSIAAFF